jgi:hypothetical protein
VICCDRTYVCRANGEQECLTHGGFDTCCAQPDCPGNSSEERRKAGLRRLGIIINE